ncbi:MULTISPECIES: hypothetical protein [Streptomyces]|uniref:Secreted protein n=1 Tax=Streptomyces chartreusis NRRL 3882 TaxID=1079985 RepID=A0A2N9BKN7_STRCX|nr:MULTISPECIES: hypothetical protein [Streptomyces]MYS94679.1 hypothetical protein [Streptomyces sp. SID5464]SOR83925.1 hypothetical protein SCNRRL3882_7371 [Streptomyces chartreusis NRRL 3882]
MSQLFPVLVVAGVLAVVMGFFAWLASLVRRRGLAGSGISAAMASYEEAFKVTAHDAHYEIQAQAEARSPMAAPGDPWRPGPHGYGSRRADGWTTVHRRRVWGRALRRRLGRASR